MMILIPPASFGRKMAWRQFVAAIRWPTEGATS